MSRDYPCKAWRGSFIKGCHADGYAPYLNPLQTHTLTPRPLWLWLKDVSNEWPQQFAVWLNQRCHAVNVILSFVFCSLIAAHSETTRILYLGASDNTPEKPYMTQFTECFVSDFFLFHQIPYRFDLMMRNTHWTDGNSSIPIRINPGHTARPGA